MAEFGDDDLLAQIAKRKLKEQQASQSTVTPQHQFSTDYINSVLNGTVKKKVSTEGSPSGADLSQNGSVPSQVSPNDGLIEQLKANQANQLIPAQTSLPPMILNKAGKEEYDAKLKSQRQSLSSNIDQAQQAYDAIHGQKASQKILDAVDNQTGGDKGSINAYSVAGAVNVGLAKTTEGALGFSKLLDAVNNATSIEPNKGESVGSQMLNWATNYLNKTAKDAPLPDTFAGKATHAVAGILPAALVGLATGGVSAEAELAGTYLTESQILQQALTKASGPITKYLALEGAGTGLKKGFDKNKGILPTLLEGLKGGSQGFQSGVALEGQMAAGEQIGGGLFKLAKKLGVTNEDGLLTKQALKSIIGTPTAFATSSVADDLANGQKPDWEKAGISAITALPFEAQHLFEAGGQSADLKEHKAAIDENVKKVMDIANGNKVANFLHATPDDIAEATANPKNSNELLIQSLGKGIEAQKASTYQDKNSLHIEQLNLQQQSDIKSVVDVILNDKDGFIKSIKESDLPDEDKLHLVDKAYTIYNNLDPTQQKKADLSQQIQDVSTKIEQLNALPESKDPIQKTEKEVAIENLQKQEDELYKALKPVIQKEHEVIQNKVNETPTEASTPDEKVLPNEPQANEQGVQATDSTQPNEEVKNNQVGGNENAVQEQSTGEMGVRQQSAVGEGVGRQDRPKEPTNQGKQDESNQQKEVNIKLQENESTNAKESNSEEGGSSKKTEEVAKEPQTEQKPVASKKIKIDKFPLIQPSKLKGTDYHLAVGELPDGTHAIVDTKGGMVISKPYDGKWEAINAYEKNREKLTPKLIEDAVSKLKTADKALEVTDDTPKKKIVDLSEKGQAEFDKDNEHAGITYDQVKQYEQARTGTPGLSKGDGETTKVVQEDVQSPKPDVSTGKAESVTHKDLRQEPEQQPSGQVVDPKKQAILDKIAENEKGLSKALKAQRGKLNAGLPIDPEVVKKAIGLMKSYGELGLYKFHEIVKRWIDRFGNENFTDEDANALKAAYTGYVSTLDPKERKNYNTLKEVDDFMKSDLKILQGKEDRATLPERQKAEDRLPVPVTESELKKSEGKRIYSQMGNLKRQTIANLSQLKEFAKDIKDWNPYEEVRKYATSKSQSSVILKTATKGILNLVGKKGWDTMREALAESRLKGARERWSNFAKDVENKSDEQIKDIFDDGVDGDMYDLVSKLKPLQGETNPAKFAVSLIATGRIPEARQYLSDVFHSASDNVLNMSTFSDGQKFDEVVKDGKFVDPKMQEALGKYKEFIEKPIADSHASNEGIFSDALGPLDTYFPMSRLGKGEKQGLIPKGLSFKRPQNINNQFFTGHGDNYSTTIADLSNKLTGAIKTNNKANAIDALKEVGLVQDVPHNAPETDEMQVGDEMYKAIKQKVGESRTIMQDGKITHTASKYVMMPKWLHDELKPIFESTDQFDKYSAFGKAMNLLVKFQLGGPLEASAHAIRLTGVITNSNPFVTEWAYKNGLIGKAGGLIANNPVTKSLTSLIKIVTQDISSDAALATIQKMAKEGFIPEKTWTKTWSKEFAELNNAKKVPFYDFSPVLYGKRSFDLKARVLAYRLTEAMSPDASPQLHQKIQDELGVYTKSLQSELGRKLKESGLAPYYTFGSAIYGAGLRTVLGLSPLPVERPTLKDAFTTGQGAKQASKLLGYKAAQLVTGGVIGATAYWMTTYHAITGQWPWEDESSKVGRIPFPESAKNDLTKKFFFKNGEWEDIDLFGSQFPVMSRGMRALGAPKAWEVSQLGGTPGQAFEAGSTQALNTFASPITSAPVTQFLSTAITGDAPYMTSMRDDQGKPSPGFFKKVKAVDFGMQYPANALVALQTLNPAIDKGVDFLNEKTGFEKSLFGIPNVKSGNHADDGFTSMLGYIRDIGLPRVGVAHGNDEAKAHFIEQEQHRLEKTLEKEAE